MTPSLEDIINYVDISPNLGTAGQPTRDQFAAIQQAGFEVVINLLPSSSPKAIADEEALVNSLGIDYITIPVVWTEPTAADLDRFFEAMQQNQGRKVFVHCAMNMRVSAFVFLYRVLVEGAAVEDAKWAMLELWEPDPVWQAFIDQSLQR